MRMGRPRPIKKAGGHRVIVRFAEPVVAAAWHGEAESRGRELLKRKVRELGKKPGVLHAQGLHHVNMAVASCHSQEAQEQLMRDLEKDPFVEVSTPDTVVHFDVGSARGAGGDEGTERPLQDYRRCSAQSACAAMRLLGNCCPANDGMFLACCDGPTTQNLVALRSLNRRYVTVLLNGTLRADRDAVGPAEQFQLFHNRDGSVSLRSHNHRYVSAGDTGGLSANSSRIYYHQRFELIHNDDKTVSLKTQWDRHFAFKRDGRLRADRRAHDYWVKFRMELVGGPSQRFPNDANFTYLWGMHDQADRDIDAPEAWRTFTGEYSPGIIVGVIDTGIDYTHQDLKENMWVNPGEIPGNGLDDDGNGYVDDVHGADFYGGHGDPFDEQLHGTHCAGTIAGVGNNGRGVAGVAWRGARLMALKFLAADGSGRTSDAVKAIDYAVAHGAKILSSSWGGGSSNAAMRLAIERAGASGVLFVAAAGNGGADNDADPHYPSSYALDGIVSVASTTHEGDLSRFSSYGAVAVDLAAPGNDIFSTVPGQRYESLSGTSMATPHVSGLAALIWMYRPALSMAQVKEIILSSVQPSRALEGKVLTGGRVNAKQALVAASAFEPPRPPVHPPRAVSFEDMDPKVGRIGGTVTIIAAADESDVEYYKVYYVSLAGYQLDAVGTVAATGKQRVELTINASTVMPHFAAGFVAVAGNASGEMPAQLGTPGVPDVTVQDFAVPEMGPQAVSWGGDEDPRPGFVAGTLELTRAADEASISHYNVYWRNETGPRGPLLGKILAAGFQEPQCTGSACSVIAETDITGGHRFDRTEYGDNEQATITASGPGTVWVTRFDAESEYDFLIVGNERLTGQPDVPMGLELPEGQVSIKWLSDESFSATGWTFDLKQSGRRTQLQIDATTPHGQGLEVVPAFGETELPQGSRVEVTDQDSRAEVQGRGADQGGLPRSSSSATAGLHSPGPGAAHPGAATGAARVQPPAAAAAPHPGRTAATAGGGEPREPWLRARPSTWGERRVVWPEGEEAVAISAASARWHRVQSSVTVPNLNAHAVVPGLRAAFEGVLIAGLPHTGESSVRLVRVLATKQRADEVPAAIVEFEVAPASDAPAAALDRIEARLILLSKGGPSAERFHKDLAAALVVEGITLPEGIRSHVSEPRQMGPTGTARRLLARAAEKDLEDQEEAEAALEGAGAAAGAALAALAAPLAVLAAVAGPLGCARRRHPCRGTTPSLEDVCVHLAEPHVPGHGTAHGAPNDLTAGGAEEQIRQ